MFQSSTVADAVGFEGVPLSSRGNHVVDLIGQRHVEAQGPLAFIVRTPPGGYLEAHFHACDQFQVIVEGSGTIGRHKVRAGFVHYADAFTPYGPLLAAQDEGFAYETLRADWCKGMYRSPQDIALAKGRSGRNLINHGPELEADIPWCARESVLDVVPRLARMNGVAAVITL